MSSFSSCEIEDDAAGRDTVRARGEKRPSYESAYRRRRVGMIRCLQTVPRKRLSFPDYCSFSVYKSDGLPEALPDVTALAT